MPKLEIEYNENVEPFMAAIRSIIEMHLKKSFDYGSGKNPYHNIEATEDMGIPAWVGVTIRMNDKEVRIKNYLKRGSLANESVRDSIHDNAVYGILRLMEYDRIQKNTLAVCKDHVFDTSGVCVVCGWSEPVSPETDYSKILADDLQGPPPVEEHHAFENGVCIRCGLIWRAYSHHLDRGNYIKGATCYPLQRAEDLKPFVAEQHLFNGNDTCRRCYLSWPAYAAAVREKRIYSGGVCEVATGMGQRAETLRYNSMGASTDD